jgi:iron complex transport system substrate-binding protein
MRVVTLLPAATEMVAALGDPSVLVGVSHECDYPPSVRQLPRVTSTLIDLDAPGRCIDKEVRQLRDSGHPVIAVDAGELRRLAPDLIITQGLCEVCAVADGEVFRLAAAMDRSPRVLSLKARDLGGIWEDIRVIAAELRLDDQGEELILGLQSRLSGMARSAAPTKLKVLCVEWLDPLYLAGHWVPEMVAAAGGTAVGTDPGSHSTRYTWQEATSLEPDLIVVMLCGFDLARTRAELEAMELPEAWHLLSSIPTWIMDGNSYTSRAGPRIVDGAECIQELLADRSSYGAERWDAAKYAPHS